MVGSHETAYAWADRKHHLWFPISFTKYSVEDGRLILRSGLLNTQVEETLLYRIVDISLRQSLAGKIFGTGDVILKTRVDATPEIILKNISKPDQVRKMLSALIEESRASQKVVGKEFYGGSSHMDMDGDGICDMDGTDL